MPYIITTTDTRLYADDPTAEFEPGAKPVQTRIAVATLEEARNLCLDLTVRSWVSSVPIENITEAGGTVGPLPDGTIIEVRQVTTAELEDAVPLERLLAHDGRLTIEQYVTAFNAR